MQSIVTSAAFNCARRYWNRFPVLSHERVAVVGAGEHAEELVSQALRVNLFAMDDGVEYRLFGDFAGYMADHPGIASFAEIGRVNPSGDSVFAHAETPEAMGAVLKGCDRVIVCEKTDAETRARIEILHALTDAPLHAHAFDPAASWPADAVFTDPAADDAALLDVARRVHAAYTRDGNAVCREKCPVIDPDACVACPVFVRAWDALSEIQFFSNLASADHMPQRLHLLHLTRAEYDAAPPEAFRQFLGLLPDGREPYAAQNLPYDDMIAAASAFYGFTPESRAVPGEANVLSARARYALMRIEHARWNRYYFMLNYAYRETPPRDELIAFFRARPDADKARFPYQSDAPDSDAALKAEAKIAREYWRVSTRTHNCLLPFDGLDFWAKLYDFFVYKYMKEIL